jgi:hypothetical protein
VLSREDRAFIDRPLFTPIALVKNSSRLFAALLLATAIGSLSYTQHHPAVAAAATVKALATRPVAHTAAMSAAIVAAPAVEDVPVVALGAQTEVRDWRAFTPKTFTVQLTPELALPFKVTQVKDNNGRTVLRARINKASDAPSGLDSAFLVSTASTADRWDAMVVLPGDQSYGITVRNGVSTVQPISNKVNCGNEGMQADLIKSGQQSAPLAVQPMAATASTGLVVNVLFLASPGSVAFYTRFNDVAQIDADCSNYVEAGNAILENSQVTNFTWNYLGVVNTPAMTYDNTAAVNSIHDALTEINTGDLATWVANEQYTMGADQVVLLAGEQAFGNIGGCAYEPGLTVNGVDDSGGAGDHHYSALNYPAWFDNVTTISIPIGPNLGVSPMTFAHESGHNFGCSHDRATMGATPGDGQYNYGYRFVDGPDPDDGDVMSYATFAIHPYYSNPSVTIPDFTTGAPIPLGVAIGQPLAADCAQVMTLSAPAMAATHLSWVPAITSQPQSTSAEVGFSFSLSATASGNGLTYQWFKNGTAISGATSATYSVTYAATTDAGSYTMTATTMGGSATTNPATVTITPYVNPVNPPSGGGSSGGGGGGAPSEWFCGALALLALARRKFKGR